MAKAMGLEDTEYGDLIWESKEILIISVWITDV